MMQIVEVKLHLLTDASGAYTGFVARTEEADGRKSAIISSELFNLDVEEREEKAEHYDYE